MTSLCASPTRHLPPLRSGSNASKTRRSRLTDAVHLSHFSEETLKVLRSSKYSLLTPAPSLLILDLFCARNLFLNGMGDGAEGGGLFLCLKKC